MKRVRTKAQQISSDRFRCLGMLSSMYGSCHFLGTVKNLTPFEKNVIKDIKCKINEVLGPYRKTTRELIRIGRMR